MATIQQIPTYINDRMPRQVGCPITEPAQLAFLHVRIHCNVLFQHFLSTTALRNPEPCLKDSWTNPKAHHSVLRASALVSALQYLTGDWTTGVRSPAEAKDFSSNLCVQTGSEANPASCKMGTGGPFPGGKERPGRDADHSPHLVPRSRISRGYTSSPPWWLHDVAGHIYLLLLSTTHTRHFLLRFSNYVQDVVTSFQTAFPCLRLSLSRNELHGSVVFILLLC
jgi:hypothetical protein